MVTTAVGQVSNLKLSTSHMNGTSNQTASFMLDGQAVSLETKHISLDEGDRLLIAGVMKHGLLQGYAYQNLTKSVFVPFPNKLVWFVTLVFCMPALLMLLAGAYGIAVFFLLFPILPFSLALRISSGNSAIRSHPEFQNI